ncbi:MAG: histidinol-phosphate transaminase [Flavisolibacter sp.]
MHFDLNNLVRENIKKLTPYSSARSEFGGNAEVFLDANENSFGSPLTKWYNRYPDPLQVELKKKIAGIKLTSPDQMLLGNGSDECIDLLIRAFCEPREDNIIVCPPTYGMYQVYADINNVPSRAVPLLENYQLDLQKLEQSIDFKTKLIFFCSPNNPTGNNLNRQEIEMVLNNFDGLVIIDEAYINYSRQKSFLSDLKDYPNLVVLQTFSKAWGLAALRLGISFASKEIIQVLNTIKPPYNISGLTQEVVMQALDNLQDVNGMIEETIKEREALKKQLLELPLVVRVFPSETNFLLVKIKNAKDVYHYLKERGIIVRNRTNVLLCDDCLRITVGTPHQDVALIKALNKYSS